MSMSGYAVFTSTYLSCLRQAVWEWTNVKEVDLVNKPSIYGIPQGYTG